MPIIQPSGSGSAIVTLGNPPDFSSAKVRIAGDLNGNNFTVDSTAISLDVTDVTSCVSAVLAANGVQSIIGLDTFTETYFGTGGLVSLSLSGCGLVAVPTLPSDCNFTGCALDVSNNLGITSWSVLGVIQVASSSISFRGCSLTVVNIGQAPGTANNSSFDFTNNQLTADGLNNFYSAMIAGSATGLSIDSSGTGNQPPDSTGLALISTLQGLGNTITTN